MWARGRRFSRVGGGGVWGEGQRCGQGAAASAGCVVEVCGVRGKGVGNGRRFSRVCGGGMWGEGQRCGQWPPLQQGGWWWWREGKQVGGGCVCAQPL
eukprot:5037973-Prymnesium_polylepis.2